MTCLRTRAPLASGALLLLLFLLFPLVGWSQTTSQTTKKTTPENNLRCWTKDSCNADLDNDKVPDGKWDGGPKASAEAKTECGGAQYGYCYPQHKPAPLGVSLPIGGTLVTNVADLGEYINLGYKFLLGIGTTIATVILMFGGFTYVYGAGRGGGAKAKKMMTNALIGLVLLMSATLLLYTVNPQLIRLQPPSLPKIRQVLLISKETSCESLIEKKYEVNPTSGKCGETQGKVLKDPNGQPLEDQTCRWITCDDTSSVDGFTFKKSCLEIKNQDTCVGCMDVTAGNKAGIPASEGLCAALTPPKIDDSTIAECHFSRDKGFSQSQVFDSTFQGQCALAVIDCTKVMQCSAYDTQTVYNNDGTEPLDSFEGAAYVTNDFSIIRDYCESNICSRVGSNHVKDRPCRLEEKEIPLNTLITTTMINCVGTPSK